MYGSFENTTFKENVKLIILQEDFRRNTQLYLNNVHIL